MVAAEAAAAGCPPLVARHSGLAEVAAGLEAEYPRAPAPPGRVRVRRRRRPAREARGAARAPGRRPRGAARGRAARGRRALVVERRSPRGCSRPSSDRARLVGADGGNLRPAWARHRSSPPTSSSHPRATRSRTAPTSRVAVEEEFALLDPETLELVDRFEELQAAARGTELEEHLVGELIASEVEVRTGRCADFARGGREDGRAPRAAPGARARAGRRCSARPARTRGAAGRTSGSSTRRTTAGTTSSSGTSSGATTPSGCTSTSASAAATARSRSATRCGATCPSCSRCRPARRSSRRSTPACTRRARRSSRACSRAAGSRTPTTAGRASRTTSRFLYQTGSIDEHTQLWWSVRPHLAYPTVEIRICDAQPDLGRVAERSRRSPTRSRRAARARSTRASRCPTCRTGCSRRTCGARSATGSSGELIDFDRGEPVPARARIEALIEWVAPVADEIGAAPFLDVPAANAAERQRARRAGGRVASSRSTPSRCRQVSALADDDADDARGRARREPAEEPRRPRSRPSTSPRRTSRPPRSPSSSRPPRSRVAGRARRHR